MMHGSYHPHIALLLSCKEFHDPYPKLTPDLPIRYASLGDVLDVSLPSRWCVSFNSMAQFHVNLMPFEYGSQYFLTPQAFHLWLTCVSTLGTS